MLVELGCDQFHETPIRFHSGLNIVVGDNNAANSIGKSSFLMIIDFVYGGKTFLSYKSDAIDELGHHSYKFCMKFDNSNYYFIRGTEEPNHVLVCDKQYKALNTIELSDYMGWLLERFGLQYTGATFRYIVSRFSRVWGKKNDDVSKPLHSVPTESNAVVVELLIRLFDRYQAIEELVSILKAEDKSHAALRAAFREKHVPKITKSKYRKNLEAIQASNAEIAEIRNDLKKFALNIRELTNREILDLKLEKDSLIDLRYKVQDELRQIQGNKDSIGTTSSKYFNRLQGFFPSINKEKLGNVDAFHNGLSVILRKELKLAERRLIMQLESINEEVGRIDSKISQLLSNVENPGTIVDRVFTLTDTLEQAEYENHFYDSHTAIEQRRKEAHEDLESAKQRIQNSISESINAAIFEIVSNVFEEGHKSPYFSADGNTYSYEVFEDTGTGTAYTSLILLDLAILKLTRLPFLMHDSHFFKNVENRTINGLIPFYDSLGKQSFIAIDEIVKYASETQEFIKSKRVLELNDSKVLYVKDWRRDSET